MPIALLETPKISATLITFAQPLLDTLPDDAGLTTYQAVFDFAAAAWNALVAEECASVTGVAPIEVIQEVLSAAAGLSDAEAEAMVNHLRWHKATSFPGDDRLVMNVKVEDRGDRMNVSALCSMKAR